MFGNMYLLADICRLDNAVVIIFNFLLGKFSERYLNVSIDIENP